MKKVTFNSKDIFEVTKLLSAIDPKKSYLPELYNMKISVEGSNAEFLKTDLVASARKCISCQKHGEDFSFMLLQEQAENISSVFAKSKEISFEVQDLRIIVTDEKDKRANLPISGDTEIFPEPRVFDSYVGKLTVDNDKVFENISKTIIASAIPGINQGFCGINFAKQKDGFFTVSTDGVRMTVCAFCDSDVSGMDFPGIEAQNFLVAADQIKILQKFKKLCSGGQISLVFQKGLVEVDFLGKEFTLRLTLSEGCFPEFSEYVPNLYDRVENLTISADALDAETKSLEKVYQDNGLRILLGAEEGKMSILAFSENFGEFSTKLKCESGESMKQVGINAKFLRDALSTMKKQTVAIFCEGEGLPFYLTDSKDRKNTVHVIMTLY